METYKIIFISVSLVLLAINLLFFAKKVILNKRRANENNFVIANTITDSALILITGVILSVSTVFMNATDVSSVDYNSVFTIMTALISAGQILVYRKKVIIRNNEITVLPYIGKTAKYSFSDIGEIRKFKSAKGTVLYTAFQGKREMFVFSEKYTGADLFLAKALNLKIKIINAE